MLKHIQFRIYSIQFLKKIKWKRMNTAKCLNNSCISSTSYLWAFHQKSTSFSAYRMKVFVTALPCTLIQLAKWLLTYLTKLLSHISKQKTHSIPTSLLTSLINNFSLTKTHKSNANNCLLCHYTRFKETS